MFTAIISEPVIAAGTTIGPNAAIYDNLLSDRYRVVDTFTGNQLPEANPHAFQAGFGNQYYMYKDLLDNYENDLKFAAGVNVYYTAEHTGDVLMEIPSALVDFFATEESWTNFVKGVKGKNYDATLNSMFTSDYSSDSGLSMADDLTDLENLRSLNKYIDACKSICDAGKDYGDFINDTNSAFQHLDRYCHHDLTFTDEVPATCETDGNIGYWTCSKCGEFFADESAENSLKEEELLVKAFGHDWADTEYIWADDYSTVTAIRICANNSEHIETETVHTTSSITKAATYTAKGQTTYIGQFENEAFGEQSKTVTNVEKLDKKENPIIVKTKKPVVKYANLKKKDQTITVKNAFAVSKAKGKVTYKKFSGNKKITISSAGKITVKKGLKKGKYKLKVKVTAAGNTTYKKETKTVTVTITVK